MAYPELELTDEQIEQVYNLIDMDGDGSIDKKEMEFFLKLIMTIQRNLRFKSAKTFIRRENLKEQTKQQIKDQKIKEKYDRQQD